MLLNNQWVKVEIKRQIKKNTLREMIMEIQHTKTGNAKAVLRGKFIGKHAYNSKHEKPQIINLT